MIILGVFEEGISVINQLLIIYLIKGCEFKFDYRKILLALLLSFFSFAIYELYSVIGVTLILNLCIEFYVFVSVVKLGRKEKCIWFLVVSFLETFLIVIADLLIGNKDTSNELYVLLDLISIMSVFFIIALVSGWKFFSYRNKKVESTNLYIQIYLTIGLLSGTFMILGINMYGDYISTRFSVALIILAMLITFANILVYVYYNQRQAERDKYKADASSLQLSLQLQDKYFKDMVNSYTDLRRFRHDFRGYLNTINLLIEEHNYEELLALTRDVKNSISSDILNCCGNVYISASIHQFLGLMENEEIKFIFEYNVRDEILIKSHYLCSLFYNLTSNAVEAAMKYNGEKFVKLSISQKSNSIKIEIVNSVNKSFSLDELRNGKTNKEDKENHGFGLMNINAIISEHNGKMDQEVVDNQLQTKILLLNVFKIS